MSAKDEFQREYRYLDSMKLNVIVIHLTPFQASLMTSLLDRILCINGYSSNLLDDPEESAEHLQHLRTLAHWLYAVLVPNYGKLEPTNERDRAFENFMRIPKIAIRRRGNVIELLMKSKGQWRLITTLDEEELISVERIDSLEEFEPITTPEWMG